MNYLLKCSRCGATAWVGGSLEDPETGVADLDDDQPAWARDGEDATDCDHEDYTVIDSEPAEPLEDDVF